MKAYFALAGATAVAITAGAVALQNMTNSTLTPPFTADSTHGVFLVVTDIHFDPYSDPAIVPNLQEGQPDGTGSDGWETIFAGGTQSWPRWRDDANYTLTRSALDTVDDLGLSYDYVLYTGDYLDHWFEGQFRSSGDSSKGTMEQFSIQTTAYINAQLDAVSNDAPVFGVIGNTDNACTDYVVTPDGQYLNDLKSPWDTQAGGTGNFDHFALLGSYTVPHPTVDGQEIIVLNNIFWSQKFQNDRAQCVPSSQTPGETVLGWLELQLERIENDGHTAQILLHMPPGISGFDTARKSAPRCEDRIEIYQTQYNQRFIDMLGRHPGVVIQTFSGHSHMDSFTVLPDASGNPAVASHVTPAVSPIFENNPSFALYRYDKTTGLVTDKAVYVLDNYADLQNGTASAPSWELEYTFQDTYGASDMSAASLASVGAAIQAGGPEGTSFANNYTAGSSRPSISPRNPAYDSAFTCALTNATETDFEACFCESSN